MIYRGSSAASALLSPLPSPPAVTILGVAVVRVAVPAELWNQPMLMTSGPSLSQPEPQLSHLSNGKDLLLVAETHLGYIRRSKENLGNKNGKDLEHGAILPRD